MKKTNKKSNKKSNPILKLLTILCALIGLSAAGLVCFILIYSGIKGSFSPKSNAHSPSSDEEESDISVSTADTDNNSDTETESGQPSEPAYEEPSPAPTPSPEAMSSGSYNIRNEEIWFSDSVINDVTGKWRISSLASPTDITEYALDYYNTLFASDDEIHAVVNFSSKTTTRISVLSDGVLDVEVHEYVEGEEHDAGSLFCGTVLSDYQINVGTGAVEKIQ